VSHYREIPADAEWVKIGLSAPARRAPVAANILKTSDLGKFTLEEIKDLHGMGKSALARLQQIMAAKKIKFKK
jgi:hypothetical protein